MSYYKTLGVIPHKRHTQFRKADGSLHHEEVMGIHGFAGIQSILQEVRERQAEITGVRGPVASTRPAQGGLE